MIAIKHIIGDNITEDKRVAAEVADAGPGLNQGR